MTPRERHAELSWWLIERKLMYYYPHMVAPEHRAELECSDSLYDNREEEYVRLCVRLGLPNTVSHKHDPESTPGLTGEGMFEVDFSRPSVGLVLRRYGNQGSGESAGAAGSQHRRDRAGGKQRGDEDMEVKDLLKMKLGDVLGLIAGAQQGKGDEDEAVDDADDEEEDDAPKAKKKARPADEDDEEDDEPKAKRKGKPDRKAVIAALKKFSQVEGKPAMNKVLKKVVGSTDVDDIEDEHHEDILAAVGDED